ncbi:ABC transporter substrate-binding protein [Saccharospirillum alexandrii]|uniref:ABC transporter substrate-binding protein n=1 Tax=Saccharospirillum alexandrii TaxID=2448477 RepID=UPI000FD9207F|nr:ABC transporter substrate-binding protein [Saccharospirillum alexandrii]
MKGAVPVFWKLLLVIIVSFNGLRVHADTTQGHLTISAPFEFSSLDPTQHGYLFTRMQILETLVDVSADGTLEPGLASEWQVSDDGLTWAFKIRDGVVFHDGTPLNADQVVHSLNAALQKHGPFRQAPVNTVEAAGDEVVVQLNQPYSPLPAVLANYSTAILATDAFGEDGQVNTLIGTGPFTFVSASPPHKLSVQRFDDYWGQPAAIESAEYLTGHRSESRALQARTGQADIVFNLDPVSVTQLNRVPTVNVHSDLLPRTILMKVNSGHDFLNEPEARQALSLALDRTGISRAILRTPGAEANQLLPPSLANWHIDDLPPARQNKEEATALLQSLGWQPGDDGVLTRNGERFELTLITYADRPELTTVATAIQAQLADIGIDLNVSITNSSAIPAGHQDGSLELALLARNYGFIADPLGVLIADFAGESGGDWGAMNWQHPELLGLIESQQSERDVQQYAQTAQQIARILADEMPLIPVTYYTQQTAVNDRVSNFRFDPLERNYFLNELELAQP